MLVVNTTELFHEEFAWKWNLVKGERCFSSWSSTWPPWRHVQTNNMSFPSSPGPLYQNEVKCSAFDMEMIFHSHANKTHFHKKGCALSLILKVRVFGARKCPIPGSYLCPLPSSNLHFRPPSPAPRNAEICKDEIVSYICHFQVADYKLRNWFEVKVTLYCSG